MGQPAVFPTVRGVIRGYVRSSTERPLPLGVRVLDDMLGGGLPRGSITEIVGGPTSGRTALAHMAVASATAAGALAAWVDLPNAFDPGSAEAAGTDVSRVLWVAPKERVAALRAAEQILTLGGFWIVVIDVDAPAAVSAGTWLRLRRAAMVRDTALVVLAPASIVGSFASTELEAQAIRRLFLGGRSPSSIFEGLTAQVTIQKAKGRPLPALPVDVFLSSDRPTVRARRPVPSAPLGAE